MKSLTCSLAVLACFITPVAWAATQSAKPQVELQLTQKYTVANSELVARLTATAARAQADQAASSVNADLRWAEQQLQAYPQIHWQLAGYSSNRQGDKGWQMEGDLSLRAEPKLLLPVLATLQSRLQLRSLQSEASTSAIAAAQKQARAAVVHRFVKDAQAVCQNLGLSWGGVEHVSIQGGVPVRPVVPVFMAVERSVPAPVAIGHSESHGQIDLVGAAFCNN
ncbi:SIMPL domain-containing protein [Acidithiobacillus sp. IBUN Pt1247-S3]|uniref:SIMPL domain-containing protein n=1 Tax=Acidithiobacillus sp. IBUN Pt1247-S3 TaxID=3166642 RepID=UPI0034E51864